MSIGSTWLFIILLIGCSQAPQSVSSVTVEDVPTTTAPTAAATFATSAATTSQTNPTPTRTAVSIPPVDMTQIPTPPAINQGVSLTTDQQQYQAGEMIRVSIRNGLSVPIYGFTGQTYCSIVTVERKEGDSWQEQELCVAGAPPTNEEILSGKQITVDLLPRLAAENPLPPGAYRALLTYRVGSPSGDEGSAISKEFTIQPVK